MLTQAILSIRLKIRAYFGEGIPLSVAERMRAKLHVNVLGVREESELKNRDDAFHYAKAGKLKRILFTLGSDFLDDDRFPLRQSPGLYVLSVRQDDPEDIYAALEIVDRYLTEAYRRFPEFYLQSKVIVLDEGQWIRFIMRENEIREVLAPQ